MQCVRLSYAHETSSIIVTGHTESAIGTTDTASQGVISWSRIQQQAYARPAEILEAIPGMVVTQHSGEGKANQFFMRGMNLDHGTDFATSINGVPINLPTHAHGQGYSDLNFLMPELVNRVTYRKGPYFASEGDFSAAGSAHFMYRSQLDRPIANFSVGQFGYRRGFVAGSQEVSEGVTLLTAAERLNNDGPWTVAEAMRKINAQFILSGGNSSAGWSTSLSTYAAHWNSTDQIPQRLIDAGSYQGQSFQRFDSLDSSDGASTRRASLSGTWHQTQDHEMTRLSWYLIDYDLSLYSNFTYRLSRTSDQFGQTDHRSVFGGQASQSWVTEIAEHQWIQNTIGLQFRQDHIRLGLMNTESQINQSTIRIDQVRQRLLGVYGEQAVVWNRWLRTVTGLRLDQFDARVNSELQPQNSGTASGFKSSPKLSVILEPWHQSEIFFNVGKGFHSNDARGMTTKIDPQTGQATNTAPALVSALGREVGLKTQLFPEVSTSLTFWRLNFDSELVYVGDTGSTQASRPSRRSGVEWASEWTANEYYSVNGNLAWTKPTYTDNSTNGDAIPNAVQKVAQLNLALSQWRAWSGAFSLRYIGAAPLIENNSVRSQPSVTSNLRVARKMSAQTDLYLDVFNLTNRRNNDISYYYTSRVAGESSAGVADTHVHPSLPRSLRLTAHMRF